MSEFLALKKLMHSLQGKKSIIVNIDVFLMIFFNISGRKYSNVVLKGFYLEPEMQLVFKALQNCIVELDLHFVVSIENFSFPVLSKLKTLRISETYCETFVLNILRTSNTLIKVIFEKENYRESFFALIREFFLGDNQIKELKMYVHVANRILGQTIGQSLQLESFKLCIDKLSATLTNINDFLATQTTLKNLDLCVIEDSTLKIITESLINLEYLKLHCIDSLNLDSFTRYSHLNPSVVDLKLESFTTKSILMFLKLFPNLKVLRISWATDRELLLVFKTAKKLEKIYVKQRMELSLKLYNEMKEAEEDINRNIQFLKDKS